MSFSAIFIEVSGSVLLFCLVFGMSATVDIGCLMAQLHNKRAIATAIVLQFIVLPFLGFVVVRALDLSPAMGITLLVITSSPGGSYSNWWCSMFNADLALSVTMTGISTMLSTFMLPINLLLYSRLSYDANIVSKLDWGAIFISLAIVLSAIGLGLFCSEKFNSHNFNLHANRLGNFAGISLVLFAAFLSNSDTDSQIWEREWRFYIGVAAPCFLGLIVANILSTFTRLPKPERVTVSIECCYQNVGIATSVALTMFDEEHLAEAMGVPFFYGLMEAVILSIYCIIAWKMGWTKAPANVGLWRAISTSYEIVTVEKVEDDDNDDVATVNNDAEVPPQAEGDAAFHYVQHNDTHDTTADACAACQTEESSGVKLWVRRLRRGGREKKEPSYIEMPESSAPAAQQDEVAEF